MANAVFSLKCVKKISIIKIKTEILKVLGIIMIKKIKNQVILSKIKIHLTKINQKNRLHKSLNQKISGFSIF
jgi:hypothetical protein